MKKLVGWVLAAFLMTLRALTRGRFVNDPRPTLRAQGRPYIMAALHAHQVAAVCHSDEERLAAIVSRSTDGDLLVPSLRMRGIHAVRGSSSKNGRDKGGLRAAVEMARLIEQGYAAIITVDGPRGPRGVPQPGIAVLANRTGAAILPVVAVSSRRWVLRKTWDKMQIPKPFAAVRIIYGTPIDPSQFSDRDELLREVATALRLLEESHDKV